MPVGIGFLFERSAVMKLRGLVKTAMAAAVVAVLASPSGAADMIVPELGDDGMYHHSWFLDSFLDLKEDLAESIDQNKRLVIFVEQKGCIYCEKVQKEVLADKKINDYVRENFNVIQLNLWGDREVTDFDGEVMAEKKLARRWGVIFTPTIIFLPDNLAAVEGKTGKEAEVVRMPGAFGKITFRALFEWVKGKRYETGEHFQKYIIEMMSKKDS